MNKLFAILMVIGLTFLIGCVGEDPSLGPINPNNVSCEEWQVWNGNNCQCLSELCPIPEIGVPNGYLKAFCNEQEECDTQIICNFGFELMEGEGCIQQSIITPPSAACKIAGGEWKEFPNTCVDLCEYARAEEPLACGDTMTIGCDCGIDKCWNGGECVQTDLEQACIASGGIVETGMYCKGVKDFDFAPKISPCNETIEIKFCECPERTIWDGTSCYDNYRELSETEKQACIDAGGEIGTPTTLGIPSVTQEVCVCPDEKTWNGAICVVDTGLVEIE